MVCHIAGMPPHDEARIGIWWPCLLHGENEHIASDKERPLATEATTNTTTITARADQHDIDLHKASDRVNFGSIKEPIDVPYLLGVQTDSFD